MTGPTDPTEISPPQWSAPPPTPGAPAAPAPTTGGPEFAAPAPAHETSFSPVSTARRPARKRGAVDIVLVVAAIFAIGGIGFAVGRVTGPAASTAATGTGRFQGGQLPGGGQGGQIPGGQGAGAFGLGGGVTISGEVAALTADQLTLKLASGQTIQIALDSSTTYHSQAPATAADVSTGATVQVQVGRGSGNGGPNASPGTGGGTTGGGRIELGAATSVTVVPR